MSELDLSVKLTSFRSKKESKRWMTSTMRIVLMKESDFFKEPG